MKIHFEITPEFSEKDPHILIQAAQLTDQAREVMDYLEQFSTVNQVVIPIRTDDQLVMVKIEEIIMADIDKNVLTIYTVDGFYMTKETLINFQNRVNRRNFLQISRQVLNGLFRFIGENDETLDSLFCNRYADRILLLLGVGFASSYFP